jgi:hypothetical protein
VNFNVKYYFLIIVALILGLVLVGCSLLSNVGQVPTNEQSEISYLTKEPPTDLVALWHFDEGVGTTASDSRGNGNNGTLKPTGSEPTWVIGKFGNALSFDGTDDYVDCNCKVGNFYLLDPFTIEAWINSALDNSDDVIYGNAWAEPGYHNDYCKYKDWLGYYFCGSLFQRPNRRSPHLG